MYSEAQGRGLSFVYLYIHLSIESMTSSFGKHLFCARYHAGHSIYLTYVDHLTSSHLIFKSSWAGRSDSHSFYTWRDRGSERCSDGPKATQLVRAGWQGQSPVLLIVPGSPTGSCCLVLLQSSWERKRWSWEVNRLSHWSARIPNRQN